MAGDITLTQVSNMASESAFGFGGKVLAQYPSVLKPNNVESLIVLGIG